MLDGAEMHAYDIHAVWPHGAYLPSKTRAAIDTLVAEVPPLLEADVVQSTRRRPGSSR